MGWLIALAVIVLLAFLPLGVSAKYDGGGPRVALKAGFLRFKLYPRKKMQQKQKSSKKTAKKQKKEKDKLLPDGKLTDFIPLVRVGLDFLKEFLTRRMRVRDLELVVTLAGDDPCDLAVNYGRAWAALGSLTPQLDRFFIIKKRHLEVQCDFTADKTVVRGHIDAKVTLGRLLCMLTVYGTRAVREFLNIRKSRKGGAT